MNIPRIFVVSRAKLFFLFLAIVPSASYSQPVIDEALKNDLPKVEIDKLIVFVSKVYGKEILEIGQKVCHAPRLHRCVTAFFKSKKLTESFYEFYSATLFYNGWPETPIGNEDKKYHKGNWFTSGELNAHKQKRFSLPLVNVYINPDTDGITDKEIKQLLTAIQNNDYLISLESETANMLKTNYENPEQYLKELIKPERIWQIRRGKDGVYEVSLFADKFAASWKLLNFSHKGNRFVLVYFSDVFN